MNELLKSVDLYPVEFEKTSLIRPYALLLLYMYSEDYIALVKLSTEKPPESYCGHIVVAYKDFRGRLHNYRHFDVPHGLSHTELADVENGISFYALTCTMPNDHPLFYCVSEIVDLRKKCSDSDLSKLNRLLFDVYEELNKYTKEHIKENIKDTLKDVLSRSSVCHQNENDDEIVKLIQFFLGASKGCVVHPYASAKRYLYGFPEDVFYSVAYNKREDALAFQLFYTLIGVNAKCESGNIPLELADFTADYLIYDETCDFYSEQPVWDCLRSTVANNARGVFLVHARTLLNFKSKCAGASYILSEKISHIVFLPFGTALLVVNSNKKSKGNVTLVDATCSETDFNVNRILMDIKNKRYCYDLNVNEFETSDFHFSLDAILGPRKRAIVAMEKNSIRFDEIVEEIFLMPFNVKNKRERVSTMSIREGYHPLKPYYCRKKQNFVWISENEALKRYKNKALFVLQGERKIIPVVFVYNDEDLIELYVSRPARLYKVDEEKVDIAYLVNEMNKEYYQTQLFPARGGSFPIHCNRKDLHNSYIILPDTHDSRTPAIRQSIYLNEAKQKYIRKLIKEYGLNINGDYENVRLQPRTLLNDNKYEIIECLGSGGFGITYKACRLIDEEGNPCKQIVALKEFFYSGIQGRGDDNKVVAPVGDIAEEISLVRRKFMTEARKIKELDSDKIIKVFDVFDENNTCYYTMEYIQGCNLDEYVNKKGFLAEQEAILIIRQVGEALKKMHEKQMAHFDVKPKNIMIGDDGRVILIDFGAAHKYMNNNTTFLDFSSPGFTAPEAINKDRFYPTYDIYSLGATLLFMLTGNSQAEDGSEIHGGESPEKQSFSELFNQNASLQTRECVLQATSFQPGLRPQSVDKFLAMLPLVNEMNGAM